MATNVQPYIFNAEEGETPASIAYKRRMIAALAGQAGSGASSIGEGLLRLGQGLSARMGYNKLNRQYNEGMASGAADWSPIESGLNTWAAGGYGADMNWGGDGNMSGVMPSASGGYEPVAFNGSQQDFVNMLMPSAMQASQITGVDPRIIVAQAAQETGWGRAAPGNNYFGIKSHGQGGGQTFKTHEYVNGQRVSMNDSFRSYNSPSDSVMGYADFLMQNPRYRPMMAAQGLDAQLVELGRSGYATDPNYAASVGRIARSISMPGQSEQPVQVASNALLTDQIREIYGRPPRSVSAYAPPSPTSNGSPPVQVAGNMAQQRLSDTMPQRGSMAPLQPGAVPGRGLAPAGGAPIPSGRRGPVMNIPLPALLRAASNPWVMRNRAQASVINKLIELNVAQTMPLTPQQQQQMALQKLQMEQILLNMAKTRQDMEMSGKTGDIKNFEYGQKNPAYLEFLQEQAKAGADRITFEGDKAWETESAKSFVKRYDEMTKEAYSAMEMTGMLDAAETALNTGLRTGAFGETEQALRKFAVAFGAADPKTAQDAAAGDLVNALQNRMALLVRNPDSGMGLPGAASDRDVAFLKAANPGLGLTPEGNRLAIEVLRRMANRKVEIAAMADRYIADKGKLDAGFNVAVRNFAKANPMFSDLESMITGRKSEGRSIFGDDVAPLPGGRDIFGGGKLKDGTPWSLEP